MKTRITFPTLTVASQSSWRWLSPSSPTRKIHYITLHTIPTTRANNSNSKTIITATHYPGYSFQPCSPQRDCAYTTNASRHQHHNSVWTTVSLGGTTMPPIQWWVVGLRLDPLKTKMSTSRIFSFSVEACTCNIGIFKLPPY